jgi:hypothetical protein
VHKNIPLEPATPRYSRAPFVVLRKFQLTKEVFLGSSKRKRCDTMMDMAKADPWASNVCPTPDWRFGRVAFIFLRSEFGRSVQSVLFLNNEVNVRSRSGEYTRYRHRPFALPGSSV